MMGPAVQFRFLMKFPKTCHLLSSNIHSGKQLNIGVKDFSEVKIPVPWGHIAGRWWGRQDVQPVLALHGIQDNAATFDRLIPLLDTDAVLALDMPGHGWSSHTPPGFGLDFMDAVSLVRFVTHHHYQWTDPVTLLGHSFGSLLSYVYSATYPGQVRRYISLDCSRHHMAVTTRDTIRDIRNNIDKTMSYEGKTAPGYDYPELLDRLYEGRQRRVSRDACEILLSRGMNHLENGKVCFSRDIRTKLNAFSRPTVDDLLSFADRIACDVLTVQAEKGTVTGNAKGDLYRKTVDIILKKSTRNKHIVLPGNHHFHLEHPEAVACEINMFLKA